LGFNGRWRHFLPLELVVKAAKLASGAVEQRLGRFLRLIESLGNLADAQSIQVFAFQRIALAVVQLFQHFQHTTPRLARFERPGRIAIATLAAGVVPSVFDQPPLTGRVSTDVAQFVASHPTQPAVKVARVGVESVNASYERKHGFANNFLRR
jgi:hypothetical protein